MAVNIGPKIGIDGEKEYRAEMQKIIQQGKTLAAEMNALTTAVDKEDDAEKASAKVKEKLNEQIRNQRELIAKMQQAVDKSAETTGEASTQTLKWKEQLAKAQSGLNALEGQSDETTGEVKDLGDAEADATEKTSVFGDVLKANLCSDLIRKGLEMTARACKEIGKFFADAVTDAAAYADEIMTLEKTSGMSAEAIQELKYAADLLDVSFETIEGALTKTTKSMSSARDGTGAAAEAYKALGVSVTDADGNLRKSEDVFYDVIAALGKIPNETERDALAMEILGKSAKELNPLIEAGADTLSDLRKEAHKVGAVMDGDTLNALGGVQDELDRLKNTWSALKRTLGAKVGIKILPDLEKFVGLVQNLAETGNVSEFIDKMLRELTKTRNWSGVGEKIGELLGKVLGNAPKILEAGLKLAGGIIKGFIQGIPKMGEIIAEELYNSRLSDAARDAIYNLDNVKKKLEEIPGASDRVAGSLSDIAAKQTEAEHWIEIFDELSKKANPTATDTERLKTAVDKLNELFPELGLKIDDETGKWSLNTQEIRDNIDALKLRYEAEAYYAAASDTQKQIAQLEAESRAYRENAKTLKDQRDALQDFVDKKWDANAALQATWWSYNQGEISAKQYYAALSQLSGEEITTWKQASKYYQDQTNMFDTAYNNLQSLNAEYDATVKTVQEYDEKINSLRGDVDYFYDQAEQRQKEYAKKQQKTAITDYPKEIKKGAAAIAKTKGDIREATDTATGGIAEGIRDQKPNAEQAAREVIDSAETGARSEAGITGAGDTPSPLARTLGRLFGEGFALGEKDGQPTTISNAKKLALAAVQSVKDNISGAKDAGSTFSRLFAQGTTTNSVLTAVKNAAIRIAQQAIQNVIDTVNAAARGSSRGTSYESEYGTRSTPFVYTPAFDAMASGAVITNNNAPTTIGEVVFNIMVPEGTNTGDLTDEIMFKMQNAVNSRKAVFGNGLHI